MTKEKLKGLIKELQIGHSAFIKNKKEAQMISKRYGYKLSKTNHRLNGKGWLLEA